MLKEKKNHHQPTTVHCWTSPIARRLAQSSATRIQFPPAVLRKSSLHVYRDVVSTPELVYPSSCRFYGWYGQPTATSACTKNQKHILDDTKNRNNTITIESRDHTIGIMAAGLQLPRANRWYGRWDIPPGCVEPPLQT
jgi:hypothetical protein